MASMTDVLSKNSGLSEQPWIKLPYGAWSFFKQCGYTANEIGVVLFFYSKLSLTPTSDSFTVFATTQEIIDFSRVARMSVHNALSKMYKKGLIKVAPNTYDLKDFLAKMDIRGEIYKTTLPNKEET
jgi:DNA-binding MarR family transcriptional regulator